MRPDQFATYVLFIDVEPSQVDVNVHPAKHEVRFHQARLVHDFIYQALTDALAQSACIDKPTINQSAFHKQESVTPVPQVNMQQNDSAMVCESVYEAVERVPLIRVELIMAISLHLIITQARFKKLAKLKIGLVVTMVKKINHQPRSDMVSILPASSKLKLITELLQTADVNTIGFTAESDADICSMSDISLDAAGETIEALGKVICVVHGQYVMRQISKGRE